jgi:hypothetical protein
MTMSPIVRRVMMASWGHGCVGAFYAPDEQRRLADLRTKVLVSPSPLADN